jgi:hypothetical protein
MASCSGQQKKELTSTENDQQQYCLLSADSLKFKIKRALLHACCWQLIAVISETIKTINKGLIVITIMVNI